MNIIISGALGTMGKVVASASAQYEINVVAGVDREASSAFSYPVYASFEDVKEKPDVIIDFSHPSTLPSLLEYAVKNHIPAVIATTGMSDADLGLIKENSKSVPLFFTFNMSLGINLLLALSKQAASILGDGFDIEILEKHHNKKIDAPSGTAVMIANALKETVSFDPEFVYDRHSVRRKRETNEIGIHSVRGGTIVGEHEVIFAGLDETITISHSASSKSVFAVGAIKAAKFIRNCKPGLYSMKEMLEQ